MFGNTPMLCGGSQIDTCISFQSSQWSQSHSMTEKRDFAAGVQINSTTFWILGGEGGEDLYDTYTTEFIFSLFLKLETIRLLPFVTIYKMVQIFIYVAFV